MRPAATFCSSRPASAAARDLLAVDRENHVALAQRAGRRSVRVDLGDHRAALARRHLQTPRHLRRQVAERQAEAVLALLLGLLSRGLLRLWRAAAFGVEIELLDRGVQRLLLAVAHDLQRHRRARLGRGDHLLQIGRVR